MAGTGHGSPAPGGLAFQQPGPTPPQHTHPLTVVVNSVRGLPVIGLFYFLVVNPQLRSAFVSIVLGLVVVTVLALGASYVSWRRTWFFFDDAGDVRLDSGVLFRRQRRLALSRLQSVDVARPLLARLTGMSSVRVEVAGSGESVAVVEYLPVDIAEALRAEVLRRASGAAGSEQQREEPEPEQIELQVPTNDLIASLLLRGSTVVAVVLTLLGMLGVLTVAGPAGFLVVGFGVFVPVVAVLSEFTTFYGFTLARSANGLRIRSGLIGTIGQTVPPGRVHAIEFSQPILWRSRDWVRVTLNVAGSRGDADGASSAPRVLIPVATREHARDLIARLLPAWTAADVVLEPAPASVRLRAPIQHSFLAHGHDGEVLVTRRGRFVRRTAVVAHARVQSVRILQGPLQRRLGLATVRADTVPGPVRVAALHLATAEARRLADAEVVRMRAAAARAQPERWRSGAGALGEAAVMPAAPDPAWPPPPTTAGAAGWPPPAPDADPETSRSRPRGGSRGPAASRAAARRRPRDPVVTRLPPAAQSRLAVGVIGVGRAGTALGAALQQAGHRVMAVHAVSEASRDRAETWFPEAEVLDIVGVIAASDLVLFTVPDDVLAQMVAGVAASGAVRGGQIVLHASGRYGLGVLDPLTDLGCVPLALHPAMTLTGTSVDVQRLQGCPFGVTAPQELRPIAEALVVEMGGEPRWIPDAARIAYHAALSHASNHLVTLVADAAEVLRTVGVEDPARLLGPLVGATLDNVLRSGDAALTGPVARGDAGTLAAHLEVLAGSPVLPAYLAMARRTADRALASGRLSAQAGEPLLALLADRQYRERSDEDLGEG